MRRVNFLSVNVSWLEVIFFVLRFKIKWREWIKDKTNANKTLKSLNSHLTFTMVLIFLFQFQLIHEGLFLLLIILNLIKMVSSAQCATSNDLPLSVVLKTCCAIILLSTYWGFTFNPNLKTKLATYNWTRGKMIILSKYVENTRWRENYRKWS